MIALAPVARWRRAAASRLGQLGSPLSADALIGASAGAGALSSVMLFAALRRPVVLAVGPVVAVVCWRVVCSVLARRHMRRVADAMPGLAQMLGSAVAAGLSLRQALVRAARDTPEPLGPELQRVSAELELGARVDDALSRLGDRLPDADLGLLVTAILVQRRTGGDLARALRDMSARLEDRRRLAREVRGATAQARATAWMVAALPLLGAALAEAASPGLIARSLGHGVGLGILMVSATLQVLGIVMIRRIAAVGT